MRAGESPEAGRNGGTEQSKKSEPDPCDGEPEPGIAHAASVGKQQDPAPRRRLRTHVTDGSNEFGRRRWRRPRRRPADVIVTSASVARPAGPLAVSPNPAAARRPAITESITGRFPYSAWSASSGRPSPNCESRKKRRKMGPESYYETRHRPNFLSTRALMSSSGPALPSVRPGACLSVRSRGVSPSGPAPAHCPPRVVWRETSPDAAPGSPGEFASRDGAGRPIRGLAQPAVTASRPRP